MTIKELDKIQKEIEAKKKEKIQVERDIESIESEWKKQGIESIEHAVARKETIDTEIKKLGSREEKLLNRLETEYKWEVLQ